MSQKETLLTPVGRLVQGSLYDPQTTDAENKPLIIKTGPKAGEPAVKYFFSLAIEKKGEKHWAETTWGQKIWAVGHAGFPNGQAVSNTFAWKIIDGDSSIPNKAGKRPCDKEGHANHWILNFSSMFAPQILSADGSSYILEDKFVNLGDYVQVAGTVESNDSMQQPGVYLNHTHVAFVAYGKRIANGIDPKSIGFGKDVVLPSGASLTPVTQAFKPPVAPSTPAPAQAVYSPPPAMPNQGVAPAPYPAILGAPPAAPPARQMTELAQGTYDQYKAAGWNDEQLIQNGFMKP